MKNKLGVALVQEACPACGKTQDGPIIMNRLLTEKLAKEVEDLHGKVIGYADKPCKECQDLMKQGLLIIGVIEEKTDNKSNPWRSGHMWVIKQEAAENIFGKEKLKHGIVMLDIKAAKQIGLEVETI